jgi:hypothetical protein
MLINHPGSWQQFQYRPDNKNLSVMEMKSKYLHEQYLFEAQMNTLNQMHQQNTFMNGGGGGPAPAPEPTPEPTYTTEVTFYFLGNEGEVQIDLGWNPRLLEDWNLEAFGSTTGTAFEDITIDTSSPTDTIVTLKGNNTDVVLGLNVFENSTRISRVSDNLENCITAIRNNCFKNSTITDVNLNAVTTMGLEAFYNCTILDTISFNALETIPNASVDDLTYGVFNNCPLTSLDFEINFASLTTIGSYAFYKAGFRGVISPTITTIGKRAFAESAVDTINFTSAVDFDDRAFAQSQLDLITLSEDCTFFDGGVFGDVPAGGTAYVTLSDASEQAILTLVGNGWSVNP